MLTGVCADSAVAVIVAHRRGRAWKTKYPVVLALTDHDSWWAGDFHTSYRNAKKLRHEWINRDV
jgi:hypothetical protein